MGAKTILNFRFHGGKIGGLFSGSDLLLRGRVRGAVQETVSRFSWLPQCGYVRSSFGNSGLSHDGVSPLNLKFLCNPL